MKLLKRVAPSIVAAVGTLLLVMNGLTGGVASLVGCVLIVAAGAVQSDPTLRLASLLFSAPPLASISALIIAADPGSAWVVLAGYPVLYCAMLAMFAPLVLVADRWLRPRAGRVSRLLQTPFVRPLSIGVATAVGSALALLWAAGVGDDQVAAVHLALLAGVAGTTLELIKEDRRLNSTPPT